MLQAAGFIPIEFQKIREKTASLCWRIHATRCASGEALALTASKFGGRGVSEDTLCFRQSLDNSSLQPRVFHLLAQINFAELSVQLSGQLSGQSTNPELTEPAESTLLSGLPKDGLLQFYVLADDEEYGADFSEDTSDNSDKNDSGNSNGGVATSASEQGFFLHYLSAAELSDLKEQSNKPISEQINHQTTDTQDETADSAFPLVGEYALTFSVQTDYAGFTSHECAEIATQNPFELLEDVAINDKEAELFYHNIEAASNTEGHKLLGNGYYLYDDPRASSDYCLLLQIDSDSDGDNDIVWGEGGVGQFFIRKADLLARDFSCVQYIWDC